MSLTYKLWLRPSPAPLWPNSEDSIRMVPFWFAFAGSAIFVVLIWGQLTHIAHTDEETPAEV